MEFAHRSVLLNECIDALAIKPDGIYLDGTLGGAGHSLQICRNLTTGRLIGVDRDLVALEAAKKRLYRHAKKVTLVHDNFENVGAILTALGLDRIDGMLFDLGVSSPQLDDAERGFSYMADAPIVPDVGMFASFDPVALDLACAEAVNRQPVLPGSAIDTPHGAHDCDRLHAAHPNTHWHTAITHGVKIGLGSDQYTLHTV